MFFGQQLLKSPICLYRIPLRFYNFMENKPHEMSTNNQNIILIAYWIYLIIWLILECTSANTFVSYCITFYDNQRKSVIWWIVDYTLPNLFLKKKYLYTLDFFFLVCPLCYGNLWRIWHILMKPWTLPKMAQIRHKLY